MPDDAVRADDDELAELRADLDDRASADEDALKEVGRRGNLRLRVYDGREVVSAQALCDVGALLVLADRDEDGRAGVVARRLGNRAENREPFEIVALLPLGIVVRIADDVPWRLLRKRVYAFDGPDGLATESARSDDEKISLFLHTKLLVIR